MCSSLLINFCHNNFWFTVMPSISLKSVHQEKHWPVHSCPVSIPQKGTGPETEAKICPHFYDRNSPRGIMCFCKNFEHLSKVTKRWFIIKSLWEQNGKEIDENHFQGSQEGKKKNSVADDSPQRRCACPTMLPGRKQARGKETEALIF